MTTWTNLRSQPRSRSTASTHHGLGGSYWSWDGLRFGNWFWECSFRAFGATARRGSERVAIRQSMVRKVAGIWNKKWSASRSTMLFYPFYPFLKVGLWNVRALTPWAVTAVDTNVCCLWNLRALTPWAVTAVDTNVCCVKILTVRPVLPGNPPAKIAAPMMQGSTDFVLHEDPASPKLPQISIAASWNSQLLNKAAQRLRTNSHSLPIVSSITISLLSTSGHVPRHVTNFPQPTISENLFWIAL